MMKRTKRPSLPRVELAVRTMMRELGLDLDDPSLRDTPRRIAKMYANELFSGLYLQPPRMTAFPNDGKHDEMVILRHIRVISTCEHHFMPFVGKAHVGYVPRSDGYICGISKLARVVNWFARRPQVQERLTQQIVDYLQKKLQAQGVMVVIEAQHHCMVCRGVLEPDTSMVTSAFKGVFEKKDARDEFLALIGRQK
jgi:GTP cyclohydrolase I